MLVVITWLVLSQKIILLKENVVELKEEVRKHHEQTKLLRNKLISEIKRSLKPHLYDSGYVNDKKIENIVYFVLLRMVKLQVD